MTDHVTGHVTGHVTSCIMNIGDVNLNICAQYAPVISEIFVSPSVNIRPRECEVSLFVVLYPGFQTFYFFLYIMLMLNRVCSFV